MNIIVKTGHSPKEIGKELYDDLLKKLCVEVANGLPNAVVYEDGKKYKDEIIVVSDNFTFGKGGHLRKESKNLLNQLYSCNKDRNSYIFLEPNSKIDFVLGACCEVIFRSMEDFLKYKGIIDISV